MASKEEQNTTAHSNELNSKEENTLQASRSLISAKELQQKLFVFANEYFLSDVRNDKESFYALTQDDFKEYPFVISGVYLNLIMDGELEKAKELISIYPSDSFLYLTHYLIFPKITWKEFVNIINTFAEKKAHIGNVVISAGRPTILNGFNDFTRIGPFLESRKDLFIRGLNILYETNCSLFIYKLCLAEFYYQKNQLVESEVLVSQTIKEFDKNREQRLLFAALYLQAKILLAYGKSVNLKNYIKNIRDFVKKQGNAEFAYNIDALELYFSFYDGDFVDVSKNLKSTYPDEFSDFNMLDLYRYMIKMRYYIITRNYAAVVALAEKLRPLLEEGLRHMDLCELDLLLAMAFYKAEKTSLAFEALERALKIVHRRKYYRLVADEGDIMLNLLIDYTKQHGTSPFLLMLIDITRKMAIEHPLYLKIQNKIGEEFSQMEIDILKLLEQGKSKEEISEYFFITVNTVKYHMKKIYSKLNASSAHQAVWEARVLGVI